MLETLAGRLKWERTEDGIRVEMPDPAPFAEFLGLAVVAAFPFVVYALFGGFRRPPRDWWALVIVVAVASLLTVPHGIEIRGRKRLLILTSTALTVTTIERCPKSRAVDLHRLEPAFQSARFLDGERIPPANPSADRQHLRDMDNR